MNPILIATLAGVLTLIMWGCSDWLASKSSKKFSAKEVNVAMQAVGMVVIAVVWGVSPKSLGNLNDILILVLAAALFTVAYLFFIKGLSLGKAGVVVPIGNAYPVITLLLIFIFVSVLFTHLQIGAMLIVIFGSVLLGIETVNWRRLHKSFGSGVVYGVAAAVLWGVGFFILYFMINTLSWQSIELVTAEAQGIFAFAIVALSERIGVVKILQGIGKNNTGILSGLLLTAGAIAFYVGATSSKNILVPAVIASAAPLITAVLSAVFDHERMILLKRIGAILVIGGVVLLNFQ